MPRRRVMANTWRGRFPWENLNSAAAPRTTAVGHHRPNNWDLVDMIGNLWERTATPWTPSHGEGHDESPSHGCCSVENETARPLAEADRRVMKGGSHMCAPWYCFRYRPPPRQGHPVRSSAGHLGFRGALP